MIYGSDILVILVELFSYEQKQFARSTYMCRLISIRVNYMLGKQYISYTIIHERLVLFLVVEHNM